MGRLVAGQESWVGDLEGWQCDGVRVGFVDVVLARGPAAVISGDAVVVV